MRFVKFYTILWAKNQENLKKNNIAKKTLSFFWRFLKDHENLKKQPLAKYGIRSTGGMLDIKKKADNPPGYPEHS